MRTALAFRVGLSGGRKCVHGRDVGLGKRRRRRFLKFASFVLVRFRGGDSHLVGGVNGRRDGGDVYQRVDVGDVGGVSFGACVMVDLCCPGFFFIVMVHTFIDITIVHTS